jgi:hypothetical protein
MDISLNHLFATYVFQKPLDNVDSGTRFAARPLKHWRKQYQNKLGYSRASAGMPMDRPGGLVASSPTIQSTTCRGSFPMKLTIFKDSGCKSCHPIKNIVTPLKNQDKPRKPAVAACCPTIVTIRHIEKAAVAVNDFTDSVAIFNQAAFNVISSGQPAQVITSIINAYTLAQAACTVAAAAFNVPTNTTFFAASTAFKSAAAAFTNALVIITGLGGTSTIFPDIINVFNFAANAFIIPSVVSFTNVANVIETLPQTNPVVTLLNAFSEGAAAF